MKKIWLVLWVMVILFSLTACREDNGQAWASILAPESSRTESMPQSAVHQETESANAQEAQSADRNATENATESVASLISFSCIRSCTPFHDARLFLKS